MKEFYEIFGLTEEATDEELSARYEELKAKYKEDRWLDGEAGNEAARKLTQLETAYKELLLARKESARNTEGKSSFEEIAELLKSDKISEAQYLLDSFNERSAEWHYLQSVVFYKKNWTNDSKKQLEIAMQMQPDNMKYKEAYGKLNAKINYNEQSAKKQQSENPYSNAQPHTSMDGDDDRMMGGNACSECVSCCYTYLCVDCLFSLCCGCR